MVAIHGSDVHEQFLYAVAEANGSLKAGVPVRARDRIAEGLREAGYELEGWAPRPAEQLASLPKQWLVVLGAAMEDGFSFLVVPDEGLDPTLREAMKACDGVVYSNSTLEEDPQRWRNCLLVMLATGARELEDFAHELDGAPAGLAPTPEQLAAIQGCLQDGWVDCQAGVIDGAKLDANLTGIAYVFDRL